MTRMRISLTPVPDDCTDADTADDDDDDLRRVVAVRANGVGGFALPAANRVALAIADALPKPRIYPQPGDAARRKRRG